MFGGSHKPTSLSYINLNEDNGETVAGVGGEVDVYQADVAMNIGDYVYLSATALGTVTKSTTATNYANVRAGVVVGGEKTYMQAMQEDGVIGTLAAAANEKVIVMNHGICKMLADSAITALQQIGPGTVVAGRAKADTTAGRGIGVALQAQPTVGSPLRVRVWPF
jgi:hypothetical protein